MFALIRLCGVLLLPFCLLLAQSTHAVENGDARTTHTYSLGIVHGNRAFCNVYIRPSPDDGGVVKISAVFYSEACSYHYSNTIEKIFVFPDTVEMQAVDLLHRGHKQLFLTGTMGATYTYVYDYDGTNVRSFYKPTGGRVRVIPAWTRRRGWILEEHWARYHYSAFDNLGTGHDFGNNDVMRRMYWNGKHFVPEQFGETRIVDRHGHPEDLKKHIVDIITKESVSPQETPQYWTRIANDSHYSHAHRRQAVFQFFKRFVHVGMPLSELVALLHHPTWLKANDMDLIEKMLIGKISVDDNSSDTFFAMSVLPDNQGDVSSVYIGLKGRVRWSSIENALLGSSQKISNTRIAEIGFSQFD